MKIRKKTRAKVVGRHLRKDRVRKEVVGDSERPRLCVYRSNKHIYAQLINDELGVTVASASTVEKDFSPKGVDEKLTLKRREARKVGELVAERAILKSVKKVRFDRNGFGYRGRIAALADGAREKGLEF